MGAVSSVLEKARSKCRFNSDNSSSRKNDPKALRPADAFAQDETAPVLEVQEKEDEATHRNTVFELASRVVFFAVLFLYSFLAVSYLIVLCEYWGSQVQNECGGIPLLGLLWGECFLLAVIALLMAVLFTRAVRLWWNPEEKDWKFIENHHSARLTFWFWILIIYTIVLIVLLDDIESTVRITCSAVSPLTFAEEVNWLVFGLGAVSQIGTKCVNVLGNPTGSFISDSHERQKADHKKRANRLHAKHLAQHENPELVDMEVKVAEFQVVVQELENVSQDEHLHQQMDDDW